MFGRDKEPEPTGRTIDAEVEPVVLDIGAGHSEPQPGSALGEAIAAHFGIEPESIRGFVVAVEHATETGTSLSSAWSSVSTPWALRSYADELTRQLDRVE